MTRKNSGFILAVLYYILGGVSFGLFLFFVVIFWQSAAPVLEAEGLTRLLLRFLFILPVAGFIWAVKSLGFFDPFGIKGIFEHIRNVKTRPIKFVVKGPY